jgi:chromosome segregation ATPase
MGQMADDANMRFATNGVDESTIPPRTHNNPPDPIDEALAPYGDAIAEAENWMDGTPVENEAQMKAVDALIKDMKAAKKAVTAAEESEAKPFYDQWKAAKARYKPTLDDLDLRTKALVAVVDGFKRKLAAAKAEAERLARIEAARKRREAEEAARKSVEGDYEAIRAARDAKQAEKEAKEAAAAAAKDQVKGLRQTTMHEIADHRAALHWIASNDREAVTAFIEDYVRRNCASKAIDGVRVWQERVAV